MSVTDILSISKELSSLYLLHISSFTAFHSTCDSPTRCCSPPWWSVQAGRKRRCEHRNRPLASCSLLYRQTPSQRDTYSRRHTLWSPGEENLTYNPQSQLFHLCSSRENIWLDLRLSKYLIWTNHLYLRVNVPLCWGEGDSHRPCLMCCSSSHTQFLLQLDR